MFDWQETLNKLGYLTVYTALGCLMVFMLLVTYMSVAYALFGVHFNVFN